MRNILTNAPVILLGAKQAVQNYQRYRLCLERFESWRFVQTICKAQTTETDIFVGEDRASAT